MPHRGDNPQDATSFPICVLSVVALARESLGHLWPVALCYSDVIGHQCVRVLRIADVLVAPTLNKTASSHLFQESVYILQDLSSLIV